MVHGNTGEAEQKYSRGFLFKVLKAVRAGGAPPQGVAGDPKDSALHALFPSLVPYAKKGGSFNNFFKSKRGQY